MKIKIKKTFKGQDMINENHRLPVANYRKDNEYEVHAIFGKQVISGELAIEVKSDKKDNKKKKGK